MAFVQGFLATLLIDGNDTTPITVDFTLDRTKAELDKSAMDGTGFANSIPGLQSGTIAFSGHISQAELNVLEVSYEKDTTIAFGITIDEGLGTDAIYSGKFSFNDFSVDTSVEGNWAFTAGGPTDGLITFTPSVP